MTTYIVLREIAEGWEEIARPEARSAAEAIRKAIGDNSNGHYVATPARSWKPLEVSVETKRTVKLGPAA